jgi:hypothetical protein
MSITDGMIATTQVVTNGGPNGGLYNCADITFPALLLELIVLFAGMGSPNETTSSTISSGSSAPSTLLVWLSMLAFQDW